MIKALQKVKVINDRSYAYGETGTVMYIADGDYGVLVDMNNKSFGKPYRFNIGELKGV